MDGIVDRMEALDGREGVRPVSEILISVGDSDLSIGAERDGTLAVQIGEGDTAQRALGHQGTAEPGASHQPPAVSSSLLPACPARSVPQGG